jgi:hypothetical protein
LQWLKDKEFVQKIQNWSKKLVQKKLVQKNWSKKNWPKKFWPKKLAPKIGQNKMHEKKKSSLKFVHKNSSQTFVTNIRHKHSSQTFVTKIRHKNSSQKFVTKILHTIVYTYSIHTIGTKNNSDTKELAVFELRCTRKKTPGNLGS